MTRLFSGPKYSHALRNTRNRFRELYGELFGPEKFSGVLRNARLVRNRFFGIFESRDSGFERKRATIFGIRIRDGTRHLTILPSGMREIFGPAQTPYQIQWIKFMWRTASESIQNGRSNSDRLSRFSRPAHPGITAVLWFRRRTSQEPNQM